MNKVYEKQTKTGLAGDQSIENGGFFIRYIRKIESLFHFGIELFSQGKEKWIVWTIKFILLESE